MRRLTDLRRALDRRRAQAVRFAGAVFGSPAFRRWTHRICAWQPGAPLALGLLSALLTLLTLRLSTADAGWGTAFSYLGNPLLFLCNWLPVFLWLMFWYYLLARPTLAFALTALPALALACVNYYKLLLRGDPLLFADVGLIGEASAMGSRYTLRINAGVIAAVLLAIAGAAAARLWLRRTPRPRGRRRALSCAACAAILWACVGVALPNDALYAGTGLACAWLPTQSYTAHGVIYPFLRSATAETDPPPAGYDEATAAAVLASEPDSDIPADRRVDVIAVMMEAFADLSTVKPLTFAPDADPYADWHALMAESNSGRLVTNVFAGETVNTERAFLTGYLDPSDNFRAPVHSFVRYLRGQGYACVGNHPGYNWFYNRLNVNELLGFESFHFYEDRYRALAQGADIARDKDFLPAVVTDYEAAKESGRPVFSFNVTFQNHGPYATERQSDTDWLPWKDGYDEADYNIANNYLAGVADTGRQLRAMADRFRENPRPVLLVFFGDHKPWLGDDNSAYKMLGINLDVSTEEGFYNYYCTPYLIWANDAAKTALGDRFEGDGGLTGANLLMERVFTLAGWDGPAYMKQLRALAARTPFVNRLCYRNDGVLTGADAADEPEWLRSFRQVEYYEKHSAVGGP